EQRQERLDRAIVVSLGGFEQCKRQIVARGGDFRARRVLFNEIAELLGLCRVVLFVPGGPGIVQESRGRFVRIRRLGEQEGGAARQQGSRKSCREKPACRARRKHPFHQRLRGFATLLPLPLIFGSKTSRSINRRERPCRFCNTLANGRKR